MLKILTKLVKYACCGAMIFVALVLIAGSTNDAKTNPAFLIIPFLMILAGYFTYKAAKDKALEGSGFTWWLYGTFVPVISWMDVHKAPALHNSPVEFPQSQISPETTKWEMWEMEHDKPEQRKRWMNAAKDCSLVKILDEQHCIALIRGNRGGEYTTSLVMCSCHDFAKRHKPCKHMYFLAHHLGLFDPLNI